MSLYGFPRDPEATDVETPEPRMPHQRVASAPVAIPPVPPGSGGEPGPPLTTPLNWFGEPAEEGSHIPTEFGAPMTTHFGPDADPDSYLDDGYLNGGQATRAGMGTDGFGTEGLGTEGFGTASVGTAGSDILGGGTAIPGWQPQADESALQLGRAAEPPAVPTPHASALLTFPPPTTAPIRSPGHVDVPDIPPWDRKPLLVVIAAAVVLVLVSIISGVVSATMLTPNSPVASWRDAGSQPTEAPPATQPPAAPPVLNDTVTLSGVGDVIMGSAPNNLPPNNGAGFFDPVKQALASDLVMGNLETPLTEPTGRLQVRQPAVGAVLPVLPSAVVREPPARRRVPGAQPRQQPHQRHGFAGSGATPVTPSTQPGSSTPAGSTRSPT